MDTKIIQPKFNGDLLRVVGSESFLDTLSQYVFGCSMLPHEFLEKMNLFKDQILCSNMAKDLAEFEEQLDEHDPRYNSGAV